MTTMTEVIITFPLFFPPTSSKPTMFSSSLSSCNHKWFLIISKQSSLKLISNSWVEKKRILGQIATQCNSTTSYDLFLTAYLGYDINPLPNVQMHLVQNGLSFKGLIGTFSDIKHCTLLQLQDSTTQRAKITRTGFVVLVCISKKLDNKKASLILQCKIGVALAHPN